MAKQPVMGLAYLAFAALLLVAPHAVRADGPPPMPRLWEFSYTHAGQPTAIRDPVGDERRFHYDDAGRLDRIDYPRGSQTTFAYGEGRQPTMRRDAIGEWHFTYDPLGRMTGAVAPNGATIRYEYDGASRLRRIAVGDSWWLTYGYDLFNRLTKVGSPLGDVTFQRTAANAVEGQPHRQTIRRLPNGVTTTWTYDSRGLLVGLRHDHGHTLLAGWTYRYDPLGRVVAIDDAVEQARYVYDYDSAGRLADVRRNGVLTESYGYDTAGKLRRAQWEAVTRSLTFDGFGQLAAVDGLPAQYDRLGRMIGEATRAGMRHYRYDDEDRVAAAQVDGAEIRYGYDGAGHLVRRDGNGTSTFWLRDARDPAAEVLAAYVDGKLSAVRLLAGRPVATRNAGGQVRYLLEDNLGNTRVVTDGDGKVVGRRSYSSFGVTATVDAASVAPGFGGGIADSQTGLIRLGVRWYDPSTAQFLTPDPVLGKLSDPRQMDRYQYALGDPVNHADPTGLTPEGNGQQSAANTDPLYIQGDVDYIQNWIQQQVIANYLADRGVTNHWTDFGNGALEFGGAAEDYFTSAFRDAEALGGSLGDLALHPGGRQLESALLRGGAMALDVFDPFEKPIAGGAVGAMSRSGLLDRLVGAGKIGKFNKDLGLAIWFANDRANAVVGDYLNRAASGIEAGVSPSDGRQGSQTAGSQRPPALSGTSSLNRRLAEMTNPNGGSCTASTGLCPPLAAEHRDLFFPRFDGAPGGGDFGGGGGLFRPGGGSPPPPEVSVGGVYLDPQAQAALHLATLKGVSIDEASGRIVLIGDAAQTVAAAPVDLDDLGVAVAAAARQGLWPGVTIEPPAGNPESDTAYYHYFGPATEHTHAGSVLALADRWMKSISLGFDNEHPDRIVRPDVPGYQDMFDLGARYSQDDAGGWARFWIVPDRIVWETTADGLSLWCSEASMRVKTQTMAVKDGKLVDTPGVVRESDQQFAAWFTAHYDDLARLYPVYAELRELAKLVSLAAVLRDRLPPDEFARLSQVLIPSPAATPTTTPALHRIKPEGDIEISIRGGVDLEPPQDAGATPGPAGDVVQRAVEQNVPPAAAPESMPIAIGTQEYRAVSLPMTSLLRPAALDIDETDFDTETGISGRRYDSAQSRSGPFGPGWQLLRPRIGLPAPDSTDQPVVPDLVLRMAGIAEAPQFTAIQYRDDAVDLHTADGRVWELDADGGVRRIETDRLSIAYAEKDGRLDAIIHQPRQGQAWETRFIYDRGRIVKIADDRLGEATYSYDSDGLLSEMRIGNRDVRYQYDEHHHLRLRSENGETTGYTLAADGSVLARTDADGHITTYRLEPGRDGGLRRVAADRAASETLRYDGRGRVTAIEGPGWLLAASRQNGTTVRTLRVGTQTEWRDAGDARDGQLTRDIRDDRSVAIVLRPDATAKSARIQASHSGEEVDVRFDDDGSWLSIADSDGTALQRIRDMDGVVRSFSTPEGTYRLSTDAAMKSVSVQGPDRMQLQVGMDAAGQVSDIVSGSGQAAVAWHNVAGKGWELRQAGRLLRQIALDQQGRITAATAGDLTVRAEYGPGGGSITMPDGQQILARTGQYGRVVEFEEHPADSPCVMLPMPDVSGDVHVAESVVDLKRGKKKR